MLVIDSEKLSQQIHETESDYMEKSKEVLANGQETEGAKYQGKVLNRKKKLYYGVLRIIIPTTCTPCFAGKLIQTTGGNVVSVSIRAS